MILTAQQNSTLKYKELLEDSCKRWEKELAKLSKQIDNLEATDYPGRILTQETQRTLKRYNDLVHYMTRAQERLASVYLEVSKMPKGLQTVIRPSRANLIAV